jgi:M-phase inducer tyrosine phosphatase
MFRIGISSFDRLTFLIKPSSPNAMDVDSSFSQTLDHPFVDLSSPTSAPLSAALTVTGFEYFSPAPLSAAPTITGFDAFFDAVSPERSRDDICAHPAKKRRSLSPPPSSGRRRSGTIGVLESSPMGPASPSALKLERIISSGANRLGKPMLVGLGNPDAPANPNKRPRRPLVTSMLGQVDTIRSAYPVMDGREEMAEKRPQLAPSRRAFSAMLPPGSGVDLSLSSESSFDQSGDMSSPAAAHARRQQTRTLRRIEGTDNFRSGSFRGTPEELKRESPRARAMPEWGHGGLGGFGDNEAAGKVLPCHRVREDGLMRIKPTTVCQSSCLTQQQD